MTARISVRKDELNTFPRKNGQMVNERLLTCLDISPDSAIADTFEVVDANTSEKSPSVAGRTGTLHVEELVPRQAGVRVVGRVTWDEPKKP